MDLADVPLLKGLDKRTLERVAEQGKAPDLRGW